MLQSTTNSVPTTSSKFSSDSEEQALAQAPNDEETKAAPQPEMNSLIEDEENQAEIPA
jgi:hypothetical protein